MMTFQQLECKPSERPKYIYDPISASSQIRLIRYSDEQHPELGVDFSIHAYSLDDASCPSYIAFSYVWGSEKHSEISISGRSLLVTNNLYEALKAFCPGNDPIPRGLTGFNQSYLWIDAICIDQTNLEERGKQVLRMGDIYSKAALTMAWLGGTYDDSNIAFDIIEKLGNTSPEQSPLEFMRALLPKPEDKTSWLALDRLFDRPYWQRVWIRQELVLSENMRFACGDRQCSEMELHNTLFWLHRALNYYTGILQSQGDLALVPNSKDGKKLVMANPGYKELNQVILAKTYITDLKIRLPLLWNLDKSRGARSTDPRDRIFGVLGVSSDAQLLFPQPGYTASVSMVYAEFVRAYIKEYGDLDVICFGRPSRVQSDLPSWIPDWSGQNMNMHYMVSYRSMVWAHKELVKIGRKQEEDAPVAYSASADIPPTVEFSSDLTMLSASGLLVATIDGLGYAMDNNYVPVNLIQSRAEANQVGAGSCNGSSLREAIARALLLDRYKSRPVYPSYCNPAFDEIALRAVHSIKDSYSFFPNWFQKNRSFLIRGRSLQEWVLEWTAHYDPPSAKESVSSDSRLYTLDAASRMFLFCKRLMTTTDGRIGMVPQSSRPGDQVWIIFGCSVPVVVRVSGERKELVGECYVDGIMDGEAVEEYRRDKTQERRLVLQ
jgi:hypothetical protein